MPEPNLPPLYVHLNENTENVHDLVNATSLKKLIPEMPQETRQKLETNYNIHKSLIIVLVV